MRFLVPALMLFALPAFAQNNTATPAAPAAPKPAVNQDWKKLAHPMDDDSHSTFMNRYVYFDENTTDKTIGLAVPVMSQAEIVEWIKVNLGRIMTLDGARFDSQVRATQTLFTPSGYADYAVYLQKAGMGKFLKDNQFKVAAFVDGDPTLTGQGVRTTPGATAQDTAIRTYVWQADVRLVLSYLNYRNQPPASLFQEKDPRKIINRFPVNVRLELVRIPMQKDNNVVAINRISFSTK